jgi:hypothetical protein
MATHSTSLARAAKQQQEQQQQHASLGSTGSRAARGDGVIPLSSISSGEVISSGEALARKSRIVDAWGESFGNGN